MGTLSTGTVIAVDDPRGLGRVRVRLDRGASTPWLLVLTRDAAPLDGLVWTPARGQEVLVALRDPSEGVGGVVLGVLGSATPDPVGPGARWGQFSVQVDAGASTLHVGMAGTNLRFDAPGGAVTLDTEHPVNLPCATAITRIQAREMTVEVSGAVRIQAGRARLEIGSARIDSGHTIVLANRIDLNP